MKRNVRPVAQASPDEAVLPGARVGSSRASWSRQRRRAAGATVGVGLAVLTELMEGLVDDVVRPKGERNAERTVVRHGHEDRRGHARRPACRGKVPAGRDRVWLGQVTRPRLSVHYQ